MFPFGRKKVQKSQTKDLYQPFEACFNYIPHPMDKTKVNKMISLEERYYKEDYDIELVDKLCDLYSVSNL